MNWSDYPELCVPVKWLSSGDPGCPYFQIIDDVTWEILIQSSGENEPTVYTLAVGGVEMLDFDEWPASWSGIQDDD